jgi:ABC-type nitrate/sulfonate/bicarbonate transport system permease component
VRVFEPLFSSIYAIPIVILFPLCILFFGIGPESKIAFGATYGFFPIVLNTIAGFGHVDDRYVRWARSMGASEPQLFRHVMLPAALPVVMSGLRIGFVITFASTIGGETLASLQGLGNRIVYFGELMRGAEMFAYIAFVIAFAFLVNALSLLLEKRGGRH